MLEGCVVAKPVVVAATHSKQPRRASGCVCRSHLQADAGGDGVEHDGSGVEKDEG